MYLICFGLIFPDSFLVPCPWSTDMSFALIVQKLIRIHYGLSLFTPFQTFSSSTWHMLPHPSPFIFIWLTPTFLMAQVTYLCFQLSSPAPLASFQMSFTHTPAPPPVSLVHASIVLCIVSRSFGSQIHHELPKTKGYVIHAFLYPPRTAVGLQVLNIEWMNKLMENIEEGTYLDLF